MHITKEELIDEINAFDKFYFTFLYISIFCRIIKAIVLMFI